VKILEYFKRELSVTKDLPFFSDNRGKCTFSLVRQSHVVPRNEGGDKLMRHRHHPLVGPFENTLPF
jgi:hypothetical protein